MRIMGLRKLLLLTSVVSAGGIVPAGAAADATYNVNTIADTNAVNPAVSPCADSSGNVSLRAALECINTIPPSGTAAIKVPAGTYTLTVAGGQGQGTNGALLAASSAPIVIDGAGASSTTLDANRKLHGV